jgi:hypothetical protein
MYFHCYIRSVLCILSHCVVLCIVGAQMCTVLLPLGVNPIAVNKYIISTQRRRTANTCKIKRFTVLQWRLYADSAMMLDILHPTLLSSMFPNLPSPFLASVTWGAVSGTYGDSTAPVSKNMPLDCDS